MRAARLWEHVRSNVIGYICLLWLMTGTAVAAADLPAHSVGTRQLRNGAVTASKVKRGSLTGRQIKADALTGRQILESSLGVVPHAGDAARLAGVGAAGYQRRVTGTCAAGSAVRQVGADGGVTCQPVGAVTSVTGADGVKAAATGGDVTLSADDTVLQRRIQAGCSTAIMAVSASGSPTCADRQIQALSRTVPVNHGLNFGNFGDVSVGLSCATGFTRMLLINESGGEATTNWVYSDGSAMHASGTSVAKGTPVLIDTTTNRIEGQFIQAGASSVTTLNIHVFNGGGDCEITGTSVKAGL